jgi:hypothetical protein
MAYEGFSQLSHSLKNQGVKDPDAVAASIGRKKYGKKKFQKAAATGHSLKGAHAQAEALK